ncbi:hypothetical protein N7G274_010129 [Stereocaulon virgatum]|uniref:CCHC-type domain-containing protein n=1 Tax=Stereocaulon virgatum TaxID=373712 RepID=A0ABR4A1D6_9LECA
MADASPRFPNWGYKNADNKTMCHAMIAMAGQMDAWIDCDRTVSRAELKKMTRAIADFAKQCVEEADSKLDRLLQGQVQLGEEIRKGRDTEGEHLVSLKTQLNDLAEKSKQKPSWANVASRRPPVYDATTPSRANNYHGATAKYPEILVKTNESETLVNRQRGNAELGAVVNRRIQELTMGPPARAIRILKSGDISITLDDDQQAKRLREDLSWIKGYGEGARVATISYGVIAHGIPTKALPARDGELQMDEAIKALKQRNDPYFGPTGLDIVHAKWLSKTAGKNEKASLILQLATPEQANYLQKQNLSIGQMMYSCRTYNANCRSHQCYNCWQYGHRQRYCPNTQTCPVCAPKPRAEGLSQGQYAQVQRMRRPSHSIR